MTFKNFFECLIIFITALCLGTSYAFSNKISLENYDFDIFDRDFYCGLNQNIMLIRNKGVYRLHNHTDDLKFSKQEPIAKGYSKRSFINLSAFDSRRIYNTDLEVVHSIQPIIYDAEKNLSYRLPKYNHRLSRSFGLPSIYFSGSGLKYDLVSYKNNAVLFISNNANSTRNYSQYNDYLSGYLMYFLSVNHDKNEYKFEEYSRFMHAVNSPGSNEYVTNAEISPINQNGEFFIVTSLKNDGPNYEYTIAKYSLTNLGIEVKSSHHFSGNYGNIFSNFGLGWLDENTSLFRTSNSDGRHDKKDMLHVFDWQSGSLKRSENTSIFGSINRLTSVSINGKNTLLAVTSRGFQRDDGTTGVADKIIQLNYNDINNSITSKIKHNNARFCNFGHTNAIYFEKDSEKLSLHGYFIKSFKIDDSLYKHSEEINNTSSPRCYDPKHANAKLIKNKYRNKYILSYNKICGVNKYRMKGGFSHLARDICDLQGRCHIENNSRRKIVEGNINQKWTVLFKTP